MRTTALLATLLATPLLACAPGGGDIEGLDPSSSPDRFELLGGEAVFEEYPGFGWVLEVSVEVADRAMHSGGSFELEVYLEGELDDETTLEVDDEAYLTWEDHTATFALAEVDPEVETRVDVTAVSEDGEDVAGPLSLVAE